MGGITGEKNGAEGSGPAGVGASKVEDEELEDDDPPSFELSASDPDPDLAGDLDPEPYLDPSASAELLELEDRDEHVEPAGICGLREPEA
ncbi:unnamed protein product [Phytophthora fragariaefolia]|uniref:Unnamed protein product n=1 Tax=Phytophthora fragariaefolia TaxID=1490495 RepID=A0A9W6YGW3_9STRA|nr:unnamed protein product [Phytophthora fragariaefolia]